MAPSHYQNQCYLLISEVLWHSSESNSTTSVQAIILSSQFENYTFNIAATPPNNKKNCIHLVSLCLHEQVGNTIVDGWPQFECNFNVFADTILPYGSHCIDMTASPRTYQRLYRHMVVMLCNVWLAESSRAPVLWRHDHNVDDQNMVVLPIIGGQLAMLTEEKLPSKYNADEMISM